MDLKKENVIKIDKNQKTRLYDSDYLAFGFIASDDRNCPSPLCLVCGENLSNSSMLPSKLKRYLISKHPNLADKTKEYFQRLKESTSKQARIFERKFNISKKANQASFSVAEIVAKQMKPHTIAESLILPACVTIAKIFFGDAAAEEIKNIPLSDNTIGRRITGMSVDIDKVVMLKLKAADFFAIQVDESTDLSGKSQLLAFIRFIENDGIFEDFLCCRELPETTKGQDIYDALTSYLNHWDLTWEKCVGICTDGCPSMIASVKGFVTLVKQSQPNIFITHCFLHREALVAKAIGPELKEVLDMVVKMVNYLKSRPVKCRQFTKLCESMDAEHVTLLFHTEVRWLSRGRVLSRFYELREELMIFFTSNNIEYVKFLSDESWCLKLAYLSDIFQHLNNLNMSMQGKKENILTSVDKINAFKRKLIIWKKHASRGNCEMFPTLVQRTNLIDILPLIINHLESLIKGLDKYFPSISLEEYDWIRNPFVESLNVDFSLTDEEELAGISNDRTLRMKHTELDLDSFWILTAKECPSISNKALRILLQFSTSYLCEIGFSTMTNIKSKKRNKLLALEEEMRVCLSKTRPNYPVLFKNHQGQISH